MKTALALLAAVALLASPARAAGLPTLKMLSTKTCPACKQMEKVMQQLATGYPGKVMTEHVYLEEHPEVAKQYGVRYVPTLIFLDAHDDEVAKEVGYRTLEEVLAIFRKAGVSI
ncbi:MAG: thioredoxin family protein [Synergistaceae bacterium]|nr:thioredoxin family protein [Synergistaceae bacterium]